MPKFKVGVFGSAAGEEIDQAVDKAKELGRELGKNNLQLITGACSGLPYVVAFEAHKHGAEILGFSPCLDLEGQKKFTPEDDITIYKEIVYTPETFQFSSNNLVTKKYRNVLSTATCDAGIIIAGRWGTM